MVKFKFKFQPDWTTFYYVAFLVWNDPAALGWLQSNIFKAGYEHNSSLNFQSDRTTFYYVAVLVWNDPAALGLLQSNIFKASYEHNLSLKFQLDRISRLEVTPTVTKPAFNSSGNFNLITFYRLCSSAAK